jgi:iron complex transport system permease protein
MTTAWPVRERITILAVALVALLAMGVVVSASLGQLDVSARHVVGAALSGVGIDTTWRPSHELTEQALQQIRFPRVAMAVAVGGALAVAGASMQAIFANPLAEPGVVGVSAGGALGAAIALAFGAAGGWQVALSAFVGGLAATLLAYSTARSAGRTEMVTLLLTGIAVNAVAGAGLAFVLFAAGTAAREQIIFWQLGSLGGSRWSDALLVLGVCIAGAALAWSFGRSYDVLTLGERTAAHLGVPVERLRMVSVTLVALLSGAAVAFAGIIAFVGLVVPHIIRMAVGPAHRPLIALSLIGGAALMTWADVAARTLVHGADLPIGMLTALIGGPFFFWLVRRTRNSGGGWA